MQAVFSHVKIGGVVATPGAVVRRLDDDIAFYGGDRSQLERIKKTVGLSVRHVVSAGTTALDLCARSARELLATMATEEELPDAVIFVTQTPDHFQPSNAALLQGVLGLPKTTAAFDVNLGCSGYVYGLYLAFLMVESGGCERVLLCSGDTLSRCVHPQDKAVVPLFGDAGSATWVERSEEPLYSCFSLHTDGAGADAIRIPAGGFRLPHDSTTSVPFTDTDGNIRTAENLKMDGSAVFNFSLREVPKAIMEIMTLSGRLSSEIDFFVLHQANKYILQNISKRCGIPEDKVPMESLARFGNTSSASIPVALCAELSDPLCGGRNRLLLAGFGVGLSWASAVVECEPFRIVKVCFG